MTSRQELAAQARLEKAQAKAQAIKDSRERSQPKKPHQAQDPQESPKPSSSLNNISKEEEDNVSDICSLIGEKENISIEVTADLHDDLNGLGDSDLQEPTIKLTEKEKLFLAAYFSSGQLEKSIKAAGYKSTHKQSKLIVANRILKKYCQVVADHKNILRDLGASEVALLRLLWDKAQNARSESVQVNAMKILAQVYSMLTEGLELPKGATMRFYFEGQGGPDEGAGEEERSRQEEAQAKPLSILR